MVGNKAEVVQTIIQDKLNYDGASPSTQDPAAICGHTPPAPIGYHLNPLETAV